MSRIKGRIKEINNGTAIVVTSDGEFPVDNFDPQYAQGDNVFLTEISMSGSNSYVISSYDRSGSLFALLLVFLFIVVIVSKKWGFYSIIGMIYSFIVVFKVLIPLLLSGISPLFASILCAFLIAPFTFYVSHGFNKKTTVALISTIFTLIITGIISVIFINLAKITGFSDDETYFLHLAKGGIVNIKGIFLAGIIIGTLGILDDVTISQSAIVSQLRKSLRNIGTLDLYRKAMAVGHDHIASTVNTLVLIYTGAALPLLMLFLNSSISFGAGLSSDMISGEIVRTLVSSIGLVLAVPISTVLAVLFLED